MVALCTLARIKIQRVYSCDSGQILVKFLAKRTVCQSVLYSYSIYVIVDDKLFYVYTVPGDMVIYCIFIIIYYYKPLNVAYIQRGYPNKKLQKMNSFLSKRTVAQSLRTSSCILNKKQLSGYVMFYFIFQVFSIIL